jgi:DNA-binding MarR family transcriptional regulator
VARRRIRTNIETLRRVVREAAQRLPAPTGGGAADAAQSEPPVTVTTSAPAPDAGDESSSAEGSAATSCQDLVTDDKPLQRDVRRTLSMPTSSCHQPTRSPDIARTWPPSASAHKLIGEILRTGARLTAHRNALLAGFGMNSARLRLLKTIRRLPIPLPVAALARVMGVSRQTAQQTARDLQAAGFIMLIGNPRSGRAPLVELSPSGEMQLERLMRVERRWVAALARGYDELTLAKTAWLLRLVRERASD